MTDSASSRDDIEHLLCLQCNDNPSVARFGGTAKLVCHCTHVDGDLDPVPVESMAMTPDVWVFESN